MMGNSMRRRRGGTRGGKKKKGNGSGWQGIPGLSGPPFLVALAVVAVGMGSGYLYATQVVFPAERSDPVELSEVPDLKGTSAGEAQLLLEQQGFRPGRVDSILHPTVPAGEVVGQAPLAGQFALPGGEVELTVSLGPERRPVPDVSRLRADRALTVLETTGFTVTMDSVQADEPAGQVVSTDPEPGIRVSLPAEIRMTVSLGPPLVVFPDVVGLEEAEARAVLEEAGFRIGEVENRARFGFGDGDVLETFPVAGDSVPRGSGVRLVVRRRSLLPGGGP
jgi:eukaryotic-like serine/threonine-protein kinase